MEMVETYIVTVPEYKREVFIKGKFKLENGVIISNDVGPNYAETFCHIDSDNNERFMVIYKKLNNKDRVVKIINNTLHEIYHFIYGDLNGVEKQKDFSDGSLNMENLAYLLDYEVSQYDGEFYEKFHDRNLFEIRSNVTGVRATMEYIKNNVVEGIEFERDFEFLRELQIQYSFDETNYDYSESFDRYISVYRKYKKEMKLPKCLKEFLNDDGTLSATYVVLASKSFEKDVINPLLANNVYQENSDRGYYARKMLTYFKNAREKMQKNELAKIKHYLYQINKEEIFIYEENRIRYENFRSLLIKTFSSEYPNIDIVNDADEILNQGSFTYY